MNVYFEIYLNNFMTGLTIQMGLIPTSKALYRILFQVDAIVHTHLTSFLRKSIHNTLFESHEFGHVSCLENAEGETKTKFDVLLLCILNQIYRFFFWAKKNEK